MKYQTMTTLNNKSLEAKRMNNNIIEIIHDINGVERQEKSFQISMDFSLSDPILKSNILSFCLIISWSGK